MSGECFRWRVSEREPKALECARLAAAFSPPACRRWILPPLPQEEAVRPLRRQQAFFRNWRHLRQRHPRGRGLSPTGAEGSGVRGVYMRRAEVRPPIPRFEFPPQPVRKFPNPSSFSPRFRIFPASIATLAPHIAMYGVTDRDLGARDRDGGGDTSRPWRPTSRCTGSHISTCPLHLAMSRPEVATCTLHLAMSRPYITTFTPDIEMYRSILRDVYAPPRDVAARGRDLYAARRDVSARGRDPHAAPRDVLAVHHDLHARHRDVSVDTSRPIRCTSRCRGQRSRPVRCTSRCFGQSSRPVRCTSRCFGQRSRPARRASRCICPRSRPWGRRSRCIGRYIATFTPHLATFTPGIEISRLEVATCPPSLAMYRAIHRDLSAATRDVLARGRNLERTDLNL